jgi:hypothetical protein
MTREDLGEWTCTDMFDKCKELELIDDEAEFEDYVDDRGGLFELLDEYYEHEDLYEDD